MIALPACGLSRPSRVLVLVVALIAGALRPADRAAMAGPPEVVWRVDRPGEVVAVDTTPEGALIVSASTEGYVRVWEASTGRLIREMRAGGEGAINDIAVSPDGHSVLVGGGNFFTRDRRLTLWSLDDGSLIRDFHMPVEGVTAVAFSADGRLCAGAAGSEEDCCDGDGTDVYDTQSGALVRRWSLMQGVSIAFSPDAGSLIMGGYGGLHLYRLSDGGLVHIFNGEVRGVFSPGGSLLATTGGDGMIHLWRLSDFAQAGVLTGNTDLVGDLAFSADGSLLAGGTGGPYSSPLVAAAFVWRVADQQLTNTFAGLGSRVSVKFMPGGGELLTGEEGGALRRWSLADGHLDWSLIGPPSRDHIAVAFSADGQSIATIEYDSAVVRVVSAADGTLLREMSSSYTGYACLACSPDGSLLAAGTMGNDARPPAVVVWDFNTGQVVHTLLGHTGQITSVAFSPDSAHLASGSAPTYDRTSDSTVRIWDDRTGALVEVLSGLSAERAPVDKLAYSPGGDLLVTGHPDGSVLLRRLSDQSIVFLWTQEYALDVRGLAYSPDGTMIAATGPSPPLRVWDVRTGNLLFNPMPGYGFGTFAAFSPDGRALACSISDPHEAILFYQTSDFSLLLEYDSGISTDPRAFSFAPHGNSFAHGREGTIGVYRSPAAPCRADWNVDGVLDAMDFFAFVDSFLNCDSEIACSRDFNRDGVVDSQDFFDFVSAFFAGCE